MTCCQYTYLPTSHMIYVYTCSMGFSTTECFGNDALIILTLTGLLVQHNAYATMPLLHDCA